MSLSKKLAKIAAPVLAIGILAAVPVIGSTAAYAGDDDGTPVVTVTPTPSATTDGNPWHG